MVHSHLCARHRAHLGNQACNGLLLVALANVPASAYADDHKWSARASASASMMLSPDQLGRLHYDRTGALADVAASLEAASIFDLQLGLRAAHFPSAGGSGRMLAPTLGLRLHLSRRPFTPFVQLDGGPAFTGPLVRPRVGAAVGMDIAIAKRFTLGPTLSLEDVVQWNSQQQSSDAVFLGIGLVVSYRGFTPPPRAPAGPKRTSPPPPPPPPSNEAGPELMELIERSFPSPTSRIELLAPVLFDVNADRLQAIGVAMLHEVARMLQERQDILRIEVQGYADLRGDTEHNERLSAQRAQVVVAWLVAHGVAPERLTIAAHGASSPVEADDNESAHQQNRRVVFRVLETSAP